jgi:alpha-L-fucosidase
MLLSQNKQATQSSTGWKGVAMRAVDGNTDGVWGHGSVCHSGKPRNNWWRVNLYKDYHINMVIIYNRREAPARINNAEVEQYIWQT